MTPLFCHTAEIAAVSPLRALARLAAGGVCVRNVQKLSPSRLKICVKSKDMKKVFAILRGTCYTIEKAAPARLSRPLSALLRRPGLIAGAALFAAAACLSNALVLRIDVRGGGAYMRGLVLEALDGAGVRVFAPCGEERAEAARGALLALPGVVFAALERRGSCLVVTVEREEEAPAPAYARELAAPAAGVVEELAVLRGTALVREGDAVEAGQALVAGWFESEGQRVQTFACARCSLLCTRTFTAEAAAGEEGARRALAWARLRAGGEVVSEEVAAAPKGDGTAVYTVTLTVRVRCSVNLGEDTKG